MSRILLSIVFVFSLSSIIGQTQVWNSQKGYVAQGYDVVSYFENKAQKGKDDIVTEYNSAKFKFSSEKNKEKFVANPEKYAPQYGGYCAYALGKRDKKVKINPETFEIREGKLYLFYNKLFSNTFEKWLKEGPEELKVKADASWKKINKG